MENKSHVYIKTDEHNNIIRIEGEYSLPSDLTGWILIEEGEPSDRLNHAQNCYLDKPLMDFEHGLYNYAYIGGQIVEKDLTEEISRAEARREAEAEISRLKALLKDMDYIGVKIATGRATREEYAEQIALMTAYADRINELEEDNGR